MDLEEEKMPVVKVGEKLLIIEKRFFVDDVRRHFMGVITDVDASTLRIYGYVWVYNTRQARFNRRPEKRERLIVLGDRLIINILPQAVDIKSLVYNTDDQQRMYITDNNGYTLELSEFVSI